MFERAIIIDILSNLLDFKRNRTGKSVILFLLGVICLGWIASTVYGVASLLNKGLLGLFGVVELRGWRLALLAAAVDLLLSAICFLLIYWAMRRHLRRKIAPERTLQFEPPAPHPGLIFLLSTYSPRDSLFGAYDRIYLEDNTVREQLLKSNWGPLVVAVQHHNQNETLQHCWLLCTAGPSGSAIQFDQAAKVVKHFTASRIKCHRVEITNMNDIAEVASKVKDVYERAPHGMDLLPEQIIADCTGGTAAMSSGLVLAALLNDHKLEYFGQDPGHPIFKPNGEALTIAEIATADVLLTIAITDSAQLLPAPQNQLTHE